MLGQSVSSFPSLTAGVMVTFATNPLWVLKTRMQLDSTNVHVRPGAARRIGGTAAGSAAAAVRAIARQDGFSGFYRGLGPALLLCTHGAVQFMAYEELKSLRRRGAFGKLGAAQLPQQLDALVMGAAAKLLASGCTYPLQVVRSRMQQQLRGSKALAYNTLPRAVASVLRRDGFKGMYSGFTANAMRVCPQAGLQFFLYETARRLLGE
jgi:solute carrier family 25 (mitochondrial folate transporter), member 32